MPQQILREIEGGLDRLSAPSTAPQDWQQMFPYFQQLAQDLQMFQQRGTFPSTDLGNIPNLNGWAQNMQMFILDMRQAISTIRQTQLELCKMDENDRANQAKLLTSINDITFGIAKDRMASANKQAEAVKSIL